MRYYAHIDNNGNLQGWYNDEIHKNIPTLNIEVSYDVWMEAINNNVNFYNQKTKKFENKDLRTQEEKQQDLKKKELIELQEYLKNTDFYYVRLAETGESVPEEVIQKRTQARDKIRELQKEQNNLDESGDK